MNEIDEYISQYSVEKQEKLEEIRRIIKENAPNATQTIKWGMPTFYFNGNLVHFAMNKAHIGFYPTPNVIVHFQNQLKDYKCSKGAVQFLLSKPLPKELIAEMVKFRVVENTK